MADDGMLLNFEVGTGLIKPQLKFTGGRWRDRVKAQNGLKKWSKPEPAIVQETSTLDDDIDIGTPPTKRQRISASQSTGRRPNGPTTGANQQVASRLFTANPTAVTVFDKSTSTKQDEEPAKPSNAPLSEEAESFHALGLSARIARHLATKLEIKAPTSIQKNAIPKLVAGDDDAFLQAETGSGKTLAYLLPIVQRIMALSEGKDAEGNPIKIDRTSGLLAIVLAPTRELCQQISVVLEKVLRCAPWIVSTTVKGGESKHSEKARLRKGINILIATPGRLTDHLDHTEVLDVGTVRWLILDEGDRLMEMGFEDDIKAIVGKIRERQLKTKNKDGVVLAPILPHRRVTVLCSATMKMNVQKLGEISLEDATHIVGSAAEDKETAANADVFAAPAQLKQTYLIVPAKLRLVSLIALLKSAFSRRGSVMKAIIFISCADSVDFHYDLLQTTKPSDTTAKSPSHTAGTVSKAAYITSPANPEVNLYKLHGSLAQPVRTATLQAFATSEQPSVLVTTDISSRGLDLPSVDLVIEYDPAFSAADHVHRVGRTARAGKPGKAAMFLLPGCEEGYIAAVSGATTTQPQSYENILKQGFLSAIDYPTNSAKAAESGEDGMDDDDEEEKEAKQNTDKQSPNARAEALQLHIEQRVLASAPESSKSSSSNSKFSKSPSNKRKLPPSSSSSSLSASSNTLLDAARRGFKSHIRAYATHVRDERQYFDITQLHLGHVAKSFGLREAPGGIGGGVQRRSKVVGRSGKNIGGRGSGGGGGGNRDGAGGGGGEGQRKKLDLDDDDAGAVDEGAARRMREKMKAVMSSAGEFNIG